MKRNYYEKSTPTSQQDHMNPRFQAKTSFPTHKKSLFLRQNDYWIIRYDGHTALLKSMRGLQYLAILLSNPGREFHVSELITSPRIASTQVAGFVVHGPVTAELYTGIAVLDAQAKAEYKCQLNELRRDLDEAERFHDPVRRSQVQNEMQVITDRLASAVGFGGRDRRTSSDAERARSAVTKCIKKTVQKIGELNPSLGYHFAASIKTGYFCSYNPRPDRPVAWEVLPGTSDFLQLSSCDPKSHSVTPKVTPYLRNSDDLAHLLMGGTKVKQTKNQQFSKRKPINSR